MGKVFAQKTSYLDVSLSNIEFDYVEFQVFIKRWLNHALCWSCLLLLPETWSGRDFDWVCRTLFPNCGARQRLR